MSEFYWCFVHGTVERGDACRAATRLGPYDTPEEARRWRDRAENREDAWEAEDERWHGEDAEQDP